MTTICEMLLLGALVLSTLRLTEAHTKTYLVPWYMQVRTYRTPRLSPAPFFDEDEFGLSTFGILFTPPVGPVVPTRPSRVPGGKPGPRPPPPPPEHLIAASLLPQEEEITMASSPELMPVPPLPPPIPPPSTQLTEIQEGGHDLALPPPPPRLSPHRNHRLLTPFAFPFTEDDSRLRALRRSTVSPWSVPHAASSIIPPFDVSTTYYVYAK